MVGKGHLIGLVLYISAIIIGGCTPPGRDTDKTPTAPPKISVEDEKAMLLKQLNRRFEDPDGHFRLGQIYQSEGLWDEAEYHYNVALSFDPVHWAARAAKVKVLQESGDVVKARMAADFYINEVSASAERSLQLGLEFQKQGMGEYALTCYKQALQLAPNSAKVTKQIGYYYLNKGDDARAKEYLIRSFNLDPLQPDVGNLLGQMGVAIEVPKKTKTAAKKLDKIVEESGSETQK
jgi:tetratricopeptide (TPR) repeat protein